MKAGWQSKPFEECIAKVKYTRKIPRQDFLDDGAFPIVSQEAEFINGYWNNEADLFKVSTPLVVFGDHTKSLKYIDFDFVLGADGVKILQPKDFLLPKFFYYQLQAASLGSLGYARHYKLLKELKIAYPAKPEQQRIVAILDEAVTAIAEACSAAEQNRQNARELFESHLQSVFSQRGEGWRETTVGQLVRDGLIAKPQDGNHGETHPTKADYVEVGIPFVMAADLLGGRVDTKGCRFISEQQARSLRIGFSVDQDVLLSHKGTIGRVAILETDQEFVMLTPQVTYYRVLNKSKISNHYLYFYFHSPKFLAQIEHVAGAGSTRAYIGITKQLDLKILLPPIAIQQQLAVQFEALQDESRYLESIYTRKITALYELNQSLLHQAFSGNL